MQYLPFPEEQEWLVESLAELIRQRGWETFALAPLVEASPRFFPEAEGRAFYVLERATRRLLQYAGLGYLDVSLEVVDDPDDGADGEAFDGVGAVLKDLDKGRCVFQVSADQPNAADFLAGSMAHGVAQVYRQTHGIAGDPDDEGLLTDITAVYLGFGILSTNNALHYRTAGDVVGPFLITEWSAARGGFLSPQALAFLLAIQAKIRFGRQARRRLSGSLEPNQNRCFQAALDLFDRDFEAVRSRLIMPEREMWPAAREPEESLRPLPALSESDLPDVTFGAALPQLNAGRPVFRVRRSHALSLGLLGGVLAAFVQLTHPEFALPPEIPRSLIPEWFLPILGLATGLLLGSQQHFDVCSDPECDTRLDTESVNCPGCGGTLSGRIRHRNERLKAEERLAKHSG